MNLDGKNNPKNPLEMTEEEQKEQTKCYQRATNFLYSKLEYQLLDQLVNIVSQPRRNRSDVIDISVLNKLLEIYTITSSSIADLEEENEIDKNTKLSKNISKTV